jgi:hypothetical protein
MGITPPRCSCGSEDNRESKFTTYVQRNLVLTKLNLRSLTAKTETRREVTALCRIDEVACAGMREWPTRLHRAESNRMEAAQIAEHHRITPATRTCGETGRSTRGGEPDGGGLLVQEVNGARLPTSSCGGNAADGKQQRGDVADAEHELVSVEDDRVVACLVDAEKGRCRGGMPGVVGGLARSGGGRWSAAAP